MNKVLVTGLGIASELGICDTCKLNFTWLVNNPSVLLWADQLYIPQSSFEAEITRNDKKAEKIISMFLNMAEKQGIISKFNLTDMYQDRVGDEIYNKMLEDSQILLKTFPEIVKKGEKGVPHEIIIGDERYCGAWMSSIYAGMRVARDIDANCLFSEREHTFLKYLYGLNVNRFAGSAISNIYSEIFSLYMPEGLAVHSYAFADEENCEECVHYEQCKESYLFDTEKALEKMFKWREYDELEQAKETINKIILLKNDILSQKDINDIIKEFKEKQDKVNRNINKRFPKIERWTKMTTVLATPITIASAITGNMPLTIGGAVATSVAQATENFLEVYKSKNNWVGFVNNMKKNII